MIFLFDWGRQEKDLGPGDWRSCDHCGNHGRWRRVEVANQLRIFFVPVLVLGHRQWEMCSVCRTGFSRDDD